MLATPRKPATAHSSRWITSTVLRALADMGLKKGATITGARLQQALPDVPEARLLRGRVQLVRMGLLASKRTIGTDGHPLYLYTLTADGAIAVQAAAEGAMALCGNRSQRPPRAGTLRARLWALLRIRKVIDGDTAATVLCDAGRDDFRNVRAQCNDLLRLWAAGGHITRSQRKGPQGRSVYVLERDPGPLAPAASRKAARAAQEAARA